MPVKTERVRVPLGMVSRRRALTGAAALVLAGASLAGLSLPAWAGALDELAEKAAGQGPVVWYESSPEEAIDQVIEAFNAVYPDVEVQYIRLVGGNDMASRAVQEMQAQGHTADMLTGSADHFWELAGRGYMESVDWQGLGLDKSLTPTDFAVATAASVFVVLWNTDKVRDEEVPATWEALLDPKWTGRIGHWVNASSFAQLADYWGVDEARSKLEAFVKLKPFLFKSTFPLAQQVAAGEVDLAIGFYHTAQPPILAGGPLKAMALDLTPMYTIYSGVTKNAPNREGATLLAAWLSTPEGALAYESATHRGNPLIESTNTYALLQGKTIVEWPPEKSAELAAVSEEFNKILVTVGEAR